MAKRVSIVTPEFRAAFVHVFKPQDGIDGGAPKHSVVMLFDKTTDLSQMKALAQSTAIDFFGGADKIPAKFKSPFRDGSEKPGLEGYKDKIFVTASSNAEKFPAPGVVDANKQPILDQTQVYSGCYMRAVVTCFGYNRAGNVGVSFGLNHVQKIRDGEPFSGRGRAEDAFDDSFKNADAPTANADLSKLF